MRSWSTGQWLLRLVVFAGIVLALVALGRPGHALPGSLLGVGLLLAALFAALPESPAGLVALCYVLALAAVRERHHVDASALAVAVGLVASHVAAGLAAYAPPRATPDRPTMLLWARRGALVLVPAVVAWGVVAAVGVSGRPVWILGAALVLAATVAVTAIVQERA